MDQNNTVALCCGSKFNSFKENLPQTQQIKNNIIINRKKFSPSVVQIPTNVTKSSGFPSLTSLCTIVTQSRDRTYKNSFRRRIDSNKNRIKIHAQQIEPAGWRWKHVLPPPV